MPWYVTHFRIATPTAEILAPASQTPVCSAERAASGAPSAAQVRTTVSSSARRYQCEDRVRDELARPVVRDVAAALRAHELGRARRVGVEEHVLQRRAAAERVDRLVLDEHDRVAAAGDVGGQQLVLERRAVRVGHGRRREVQHAHARPRRRRVPVEGLVEALGLRRHGFSRRSRRGC